MQIFQHYFEDTGLQRYPLSTKKCCYFFYRIINLKPIIFPHITVGFLFSCLHPARLPSAAPSRPPRLCHQLISHTTRLTHNSSHTQLISHTDIKKLISHNSSHTTHLTHNSSYTQLISHTTHLTNHLISHITHLTQLTSHNSSLTQLISHTTHLTQLISHNASHTTHLTALIHTTHLTQVAAATCCVAGAVHRASWRSCGGDCRRLGRGSSLRGRHSTQSLLKELRRGLSPAGPRLLFAWQTQYTEPREGAAARIVAGWAAATCCVAGAVHRASWRSCGADCRRLGRGSSLRGRRSTQSLVKELRRGLSPAGPRLLVAWQVQYTEPPEGAAARIVAGWAAAPLCVADAVHRASWRSCGADCRRLGRGYLLRGRCSTQSLLKELRRGLSPAGPRLLFAWQTQYTEPPEGAAARIVAGWAAAPLCVADAVHRASWRSCGADCRRLGRGYLLRGRCSTQSLLKELRRGLSPAGPRLLFAWQTQYTEPREGAAAQIVAGWAAAPLCVADTVRGRRSTQSLLKELRRGLSPAGPRLLFVWGAIHRASWGSCGADSCRLGRSSFAQRSSTPLITHHWSHTTHRTAFIAQPVSSHNSSLTSLIPLPPQH